jgi:hypothetical protein
MRHGWDYKHYLRVLISVTLSHYLRVPTNTVKKFSDFFCIYLKRWNYNLILWNLNSQTCHSVAPVAERTYDKQGCQIYRHDLPKRENIPNDHKIYQMAVKKLEIDTKWAHILNSKALQNISKFWNVNIASGNPEAYAKYIKIENQIIKNCNLGLQKNRSAFVCKIVC